MMARMKRFADVEWTANWRKAEFVTSWSNAHCSSVSRS